MTYVVCHVCAIPTVCTVILPYEPYIVPVHVGVDVNHVREGRPSALEVACENGCLDAVRVLINADAKVDDVVSTHYRQIHSKNPHTTQHHTTP